MRAVSGAGLGLAVGLGLMLAAFAARADAPDTWYAQRLTLGDTPLRVEYFWSKGRKMRSETVVGGFPIVTIVNGEYYYVIDPLRGAGMAIRRSPAALQAEQRDRARRPFATEAEILIEQGAEKVRSEPLGGRLCDVYRITDNAGRREVWVTADALKLPLRIEAFDRMSGSTVRTDFVDWTRSLPIPDSFFEPGSDVKLERMEYDEYVRRSAEGPVGPAPILHMGLLHGR
jgi:outer membrane lipoprotein-sorting protein